MDARPYVHVIMPVGSEPRALGKKAAIATGIKHIGYEARFPDYLPQRPTFSLPELIGEMVGADAIIADLTRERPSCYYELGIAEALGKTVYIIAELGTPIHQTAKRLEVHYYRNLED